MTCGCNDKCELPKALQINNPGEVTLFHRVDIPASQGDDTTYPPKNGLYRNVLLVYLANNHSYLYNSDGIPTRVDGPAGPGTAAGGETGQVLAKRSDADYDTTWVTQTSANDAKLTLTRNNTEIGDFTANASVDKTIDIEVPTKTSDLENDGADGTSTYVEADDYATASAAGVVKVTGAFGTEMSNSGELKGAVVSTSDYPSMWNDALVSKGTLENALSTKINDATLTVTQNGTTAGTFTANSNTNTTIALTDTTYSAGEGVEINGTTINAKVRKVYNYLTSRPANANLTATGNGGMFTLQATSVMTTGKPKNDAHILHLEWDNQGGWDSQIAVNNNGSSPWIAVRAQDSGTWKDWVYLLNDTAGSVKTANIDALAVTTAKIANGAITEAKINATDWAKKVNVNSISLEGQTTTILAQVKNLGTNHIDYARFDTDTDGGSSGISDKPTGNINGGFVCIAYCNRYASSSDYEYAVLCYVHGYGANPFIATVTNNSSSISWSRLVNNATLTIQKNGTTVQTFTANSSTNKTANITVPTKTSDLTNDGSDNTSTYVEADELQPSYIEGEGTSITFTSTQGAQFKDIELKGDTKQGATLPSGYTQVEYIQNTTDAYFSFPFALTGADTITMDVQLTGAANNWATLWSARNDGAVNTNTSFVNVSTNEVRGDYATNQGSTTVTGATSRHVYQQARGNYFIDGVQKITRSATNFNTPTTTTVMASNMNGGNIGNYGRGKIYSLTIVRDYGLIHSFVPAVRNADSRAGLYDTVAGKFYVNAGTGQFTAGNPTPTPDVPQTVHTVTGEQTVSIIGNNLFEATPSMLIVHGAYVSGANTDQFKVTATSTDLYLNQILAAGSTWNKAGQGNLIPCDYGETLYFTSGNTSFTKNLVTEYNEEKVSLGYYGLSAASGSFSPRFVGCKYVTVRFGYEPATVGTTYTLAPMVSRTSITEYEPYTNQEFKINLGKNLLNTAITQPGYINSSGNYQANAQSQSSAYIEVLPNTTYTASADATYRVIGAAEYTAGKTFIQRAETTDVSSYSFTTTASTKYIRVYYNKNVNITAQTLRDDKAQIEKGSARTNYSVYADQIELCKIGSYQDYIYQSGDNWYIHKVIDKVVDNGAKDYVARSNTSATYSKFYTSTDDLLSYPIIDPTALVSDHFLPNLGANYADYSGSAACGNSTSGYKKRLWYSVPNSIATTTSAIKTWLQSNPVTTYYVMETAMDVQITGSIADQLNALASATGYRGTTAITAIVPSPDLPAILSLSTALPSALPLATTTSVGMVSVGDGLEADANGRLSVKNVDNVVYASDPTTPMDNVVDPYTYSTTETRIGTWIDGKPLYRRVFSGTMASATSTLVATIPNIVVRHTYGSLQFGDNVNNFHQIGAYANANFYSLVQFNADSSQLTIWTPATGYAGKSYVLTIEYTKTTD